MRAVAIAAILLAMFGWTFGEAAEPAAPPQRTALEKQYQAELERVNAAIGSLSDGKSRLLIDQGSGAEPQSGGVLRPAEWGNMPFVTVYPVSSPVLTDLKGVGPGRVVGAVRILTKSTNPEKISTAEPGVYMLLKFDERWLGVPKEGVTRHGVCLVKVSGDAKSGFGYEKALPTHGTADGSMVKVTMPGACDGLGDSASRAKARLIYPEGKEIIAYEFVLDLVGVVVK